MDALNYFAQRGGVPGEQTSIFSPYGGHWQPVLITMYRVLFSAFGLRAYLPYVLPAILAHLVLCALVYAILRRVEVSAWIATSTVWLLVFYGRGAEAFISDAPFALTSALTLGVAAVYLLLRWPSTRLAMIGAAGMLTIAIMCSVTGVVSIVLVFGFLLGTQGWRLAVRVAGPPLAVFLVWFAVSGRKGGRVHGSPVDLLDLPQMVWGVLVKPLGDASAISGAGAILTVVVIATTFLARGLTSELRVLAWAGILASATQLTLSSFANLALGIDALSVGRYRYVALVGLLPAASLALEVSVARFREVSQGVSRGLPALIVVVFLVGTAMNGVLDEREQWRFFAAMGRDYSSYTRGTVAASDFGERMLTDDVGGSFVTGPDLLRLATPAVRHKLPADFQATAEDRVHAESAFFVGVGPTTYRMPAPATIGSADFSEPLSEQTGCRVYRATSSTPILTFKSFEGAQIAVTSQSATIHTRLVRDGVESSPRVWGVAPGKPVFIATSAELAELLIGFDASGTYTICRA